MDITIKTLKGDVFTLQCTESDTVSALKTKIFESKFAFPIENQKLIFSGQILSDDSATLGSVGIVAGSFVVCMVSKKKKKKKKKKKVEEEKPAVSTPAPSGAKTTTESDKMEVDSTPAPTTSDETRTVPDAPSKTVEGSGTTETPSKQEDSSSSSGTNEALEQLKAMGFPEQEAKVALRAAFNNPMRAVEYLTSGIPPHLAAMAAEQNSAPRTTAPLTTSNTPPTTSTSSNSSSSSSSDDPLAVLRTDPAFQEMKRMIQRDPSKLSQIMAQIGQRQPELFRLINENKAQFLQMLNSPVESTPAATTSSPSTTPGTTLPSMGGSGGGLPAGMGMSPEMISQYLQNMPAAQRNALMQQLNITPEQLSQISQAMSRMPPQVLQQLLARGPQAMMGGMGGGSTPGQLPPGAQVVRLTQDEAAAVQRLQDLGFSRQQAIEAYLACDKNEQMAANLLFDGSFQ